MRSRYASARAAKTAAGTQFGRTERPRPRKEMPLESVARSDHSDVIGPTSLAAREETENGDGQDEGQYARTERPESDTFHEESDRRR